jgi:hypothetical protein
MHSGVISRSLACLSSVAALLVVASDATAATVRPGTPTAVDYDGTPSVGAVFDSAATPRHTFTASVIDSPAGDLLITAAHAVRGSGAGYVFVPEYHDGKEPYGAWRITAAFGSPSWIRGNSQLADVAFLQVAPRVRDGRLQQIQAVTGGNELGVAPGHGKTVSVPAYASGSDDQPFKCSAAVYYRGSYPAFDCHSYPGGTSGSPWLLATPHGPVVVGVIGGLHQGGCTVVTSYTSPFGADVRATYERAAHHQDPDTFPGPGSDGC